MQSSFQGNKSKLPSKPCKSCKSCVRDMRWRKAWAKNWGHLVHCSETCRKKNVSTSLKHSPLAAT
jgi:hypothetical protein